MERNKTGTESDADYTEMTPEARAARAAYQREYRKKHPEIAKAQVARYWQKKADKIAAEKENAVANDD